MPVSKRSLSRCTWVLGRLWEMSAGEIGAMLRHPAAGDRIYRCLVSFPALELDAHLHPITR